MVADEGRFGRLGQVMRAWCGPGIRPQGGQQLVREYLYSFVAVAPALGMMTAGCKLKKLVTEQVATWVKNGAGVK
jgi:hypothetical protein